MEVIVGSIGVIREVYMSFIISAARTPIGGFLGGLSCFGAPRLGAFVIEEAVKRSGLGPSDVGQVIMGCVITAGLGQAPARQAAIYAGLPYEVGALTVNKVCSSGLFSTILADMYIKCGFADVVVAGGMESMSNAPYLLSGARSGYKMGDAKIVDSMIYDGLFNIYNSMHMGGCAELCAEKYKISREEQDEFAIKSYNRAREATEAGRFRDEIVPVKLSSKKGETAIFDKDEEIYKVDEEKMRRLKPVFKENGTITAANASSISDGASALLIASQNAVARFGLKPLARIVAYETYSTEPEWFTMAPVGAVEKVLKKAGLNKDDISLFEINEAFSVQAIAVMRELKLSEERVNVNGGAVALGHPIGASGARILTTLIYELRRRGGGFGLASLCNGGGEASAVIIEAV